MQSGVYEIVNLINGKRYIGSAKDLKQRFRVHRHDLSKEKHHSPYLQRSVAKYGIDHFGFRAILICDKKNLLFYEQRALDVYLPEYNVSKIAGSALGCRRSDEFKLKVAAGHRDRPLSDEHKRAISLANRGKKRNPLAVQKSADARRGKKQGPLSPEHRKKIGDSHRGKKLTARHAQNISNGKTGKPRPDMAGNTYGCREHTDAERLKNSLSKKGIPKSEEARANMRAAWIIRKAKRNSQC